MFDSEVGTAENNERRSRLFFSLPLRPLQLLPSGEARGSGGVVSGRDHEPALTVISVDVAQVFINRVQLICGQPTVVKRQAAEHLWVTKHEIGEYLGESMGVYMKHLI